jgi:hypothetical protein
MPKITDFMGDNGYLILTFTPQGRVKCRPVHADAPLDRATLMDLLDHTQPTIRPITPYSQNDPRWKNQTYHADATFGQYGCLVCCIAMIASQAYDLTPPQIATELRAVGAFQGRLLTRPDRIPTALPKLEYASHTHYRTVAADIPAIAREIRTYRATIAELKSNPHGPMPQTGNQHFVVITHIDPQEATILDPVDGQEKPLSTSPYVLPGWTPSRAIYGIRRLRIRAPDSPRHSLRFVSAGDCRDGTRPPPQAVPVAIKAAKTKPEPP